MNETFSRGPCQAAGGESAVFLQHLSRAFTGFANRRSSTPQARAAPPVIGVRRGWAPRSNTQFDLDGNGAGPSPNLWARPALYKYGQGNGRQEAPDIASSWGTISKGRQDLHVFTFAPTLKWSDGQPFFVRGRQPSR